MLEQAPALETNWSLQVGFLPVEHLAAKKWGKEGATEGATKGAEREREEK